MRDADLNVGRAIDSRTRPYWQFLEAAPIKSAVETIHAAIVAGLLEGSVNTVSRRFAFA